MGRPRPVVVLIEDDSRLRRFLRVALEENDFKYVEAESGKKGALQAETHKPDLVLLDLGLPDVDGLEVIASLRRWSRVPIIVLSARGQERDKVQALDAGADDYVTKPFGVDELLARMRVALRHASRSEATEADSVFRQGALEVDFERRLVFVDGEEIHLTPIQYRLLTTLAKHAGRVVTHQQLLREVWGPNSESEKLYLRVYMNQLRHKLEPQPARPQYLVTEPGIGYRLKTS